MSREAVDSVFETFGVEALYLPPSPPGGAALPIVAVLRREDSERVMPSGAVALVAGLAVEVRASELAAPARGGVVRIGAVDYRVESDPECRDPDRLVWTLRAARS